MAAEPNATATRVDIKTLLRHPEGTDHAILGIYLEYNDILVGKGIGSFNIWMKRANYLYGLERLEEAIMAVDMALAHDRANTEALFLKGVCLQLLALRESGDGFEGPLADIPLRLLREAKGVFEQVVAANPNDDEAHTYLTNLRCLLYSPTPVVAESAAAPAPVAAQDGADEPIVDLGDHARRSHHGTGTSATPGSAHGSTTRGDNSDDDVVGAVA